MTDRSSGDRLPPEAITAIFELVDESRTAIYVASRDGGIIYRNREADQSLEKGVGGILLEEAVEDNLRSALSGETTRQLLELHGPPRQMLSITSNPLPSGGAVARVEDVTERHRVDSVRTDFVANISHELKTPVGALSVLAEAISHTDDGETVKRLADRMIAESSRVARTVEDLLELSRIEMGSSETRERVELGSAVAEAIDRARPLADSKDVHIDVKSSGRPLHVMAKRRELVSALGNLVENAVKYSDDKGRVEIVLSGESDRVTVTVSDHGPGIPHQDLDRIFERFYRVDRARSRDTGGTGLGLAIVRHVASNHGGDVSVSSVEGEGSTFTFTVPIGKSWGSR
jgi:two-component system, OmpR family, sensor histidine kinase SenX3